MVEITSTTKHSVKKPVPPAAASGKNAAAAGGGTKRPAGGNKAAGVAGIAGIARRGSTGPPLRASALSSDESVRQLKLLGREEQRARVRDLFRAAVGEHPSAALHLGAPRAASTTRDRSAAAADAAVAARELGADFVLKECGLLAEVQRVLLPQGIEVLLGKQAGSSDGELSTLKPSLSALSLSSLGGGGDNDSLSAGGGAMTDMTVGTDSKRGKTAPAAAREGCLLLLRGLCQIVGKKAEPYVVGALLAAALDECASAVGSVREAAEDASAAMVSLASPWAFRPVVAPLLLLSLGSGEWRVKAAALERLQQCAGTAPRQVEGLIPTLIPAVTSQVWDTKAQVSKAARACLQAVCETNANSDIRPAVPAVVNAICRPADTNKAVSELLGTTFVVPVNAGTLAILCPVLARALKERLAVHKRAACVVIANMSKLVETREAIAPFGSLLVPELKKVSRNVQFEEIRDEALRALASLTKALGDAYGGSGSGADDPPPSAGGGDAATDGHSLAHPSKEDMSRETSLAEAEQERIRKEREEERRREEEVRTREEEERKKFKEAMDAQRELDRIAASEAQRRRQEDDAARERQRLSTKAAGGACQGCGLKKCKKTCLFYPK